MARTVKLLTIVALLAAASLPLLVHAQGPVPADQGGRTFGGLFPIVPCGTSTTEPCTPCGLLDILENIVQFVTRGIVGPVAALLFIYAGVLFLVSAGNRYRMLQARKVLTNTVYGVAIILLAWLVVVQLIKIVAPGSAADRWYEFSCPSYLLTAADVPEVPEARVVGEREGAIAQAPMWMACDDYPTLSYVFGGQANVTQDSPELTALISCLMADPVVAALANHPDNTHTFEKSNPACNATRGAKTVCTPSCAHTVGSCHYGGYTGTTGAQAADLNAKPGVTVFYDIGTREVYSEERYNDISVAARAGDTAMQELKSRITLVNGDSGLEVAIRWVAKNKPECGALAKRIAFEKDHVHVSTSACDADGYTPR